MSEFEVELTYTVRKTVVIEASDEDHARKIGRKDFRVFTTDDDDEYGDLDSVDVLFEIDAPEVL